MMGLVMKPNAIVTFAFMASAVPLAYANPTPRMTPTPQARYVAPLQQPNANTKPVLRMIPTPQASYIVPAVPADATEVMVIPTPQARYAVVYPAPTSADPLPQVIPTPQARNMP